jgi:hypothetical protein
MAERDLVVITSRAVELGSDWLLISMSPRTARRDTHANSRLELRELVLVILSLGFWVLLQPRSLFLDGIENGLLVILGQLSTESFGISNLVLEREDKVYPSAFCINGEWKGDIL